MQKELFQTKFFFYIIWISNYSLNKVWFQKLKESFQGWYTKTINYPIKTRSAII